MGRRYWAALNFTVRRLSNVCCSETLTEVGVMLKLRTLKCSFCGKDSTEVSKLVAGPRVYICDVCVAEASRIMNDAPPAAPTSPPTGRASLWGRVGAALKRRRSPGLWCAA